MCRCSFGTGPVPVGFLAEPLTRWLLGGSPCLLRASVRFCGLALSHHGLAPDSVYLPLIRYPPRFLPDREAASFASCSLRRFRGPPLSPCLLRRRRVPLVRPVAVGLASPDSAAASLFPLPSVPLRRLSRPRPAAGSGGRGWSRRRLAAVAASARALLFSLVFAAVVVSVISVAPILLRSSLILLGVAGAGWCFYSLQPCSRLLPPVAVSYTLEYAVGCKGASRCDGPASEVSAATTPTSSVPLSADSAAC
jgi:hypothetical protein